MPRQICIKLLTVVRFQGSQDNRTPGDLALRWLSTRTSQYLKYSKPLLCLGVLPPILICIRQALSLPESCPKIGDVPKFPFPTVAARVPSAGTTNNSENMTHVAEAVPAFT
jgi:hypothetical protein